MDAIQITLAIAAATFAAAVTFAKANAEAVDGFSTNPALLTGKPSPQGNGPFNDGRIIAGPGVAVEVRG
ncbi:MAG: hypothetical protein H6887_15830 [Hoeflea sp.]|nr:hypothetical protein [Hoeflea sp.]